MIARDSSTARVQPGHDRRTTVEKTSGVLDVHRRKIVYTVVCRARGQENIAPFWLAVLLYQGCTGAASQRYTAAKEHHHNEEAGAHDQRGVGPSRSEKYPALRNRGRAEGELTSQPSDTP